jgi:hypothetical protein
LQHVKQQLQSGYRKTMPPAGTPGYDVNVSGASVNLLNFGNTKNIFLAGTAYNDANSNGVKDAGEAALPGVVVTIKSPAGGATIATRTTDANGAWKVQGLGAGSGEAGATIAGYAATNPANGKYTGSASSGEQLGNLNFGFKAAATGATVIWTTQNDFQNFHPTNTPATVGVDTIGDSDGTTTNGVGTFGGGTGTAGSLKIGLPAGSVQTYNQIASAELQPNLQAITAVKTNHIITIDYFLPTAIVAGNGGGTFWQINVIFNWDGGYQTAPIPPTTFTGAALTQGQHTVSLDYSTIAPNLPSAVQGTYYNIIFAPGYDAGQPASSLYLDNIRVSGGPAAAPAAAFSNTPITVLAGASDDKESLAADLV